MKVINIQSSNTSVIVTFDDGHHAVFEPYTHGVGYSIEGLRRFLLYNGEQLVCQYNSRLHRCGPQTDEHQIFSIANGYTPQSVAKYWWTAKAHINEEYLKKPQREHHKEPTEFWYPWKVISEGGLDLKRLDEGKTNLSM